MELFQIRCFLKEHPQDAFYSHSEKNISKTNIRQIGVIVPVSVIFCSFRYLQLFEHLQHLRTFEKETHFGRGVYSCVRNVPTKQIHWTEP